MCSGQIVVNDRLLVHAGKSNLVCCTATIAEYHNLCSVLSALTPIFCLGREITDKIELEFRDYMNSSYKDNFQLTDFYIPAFHSLFH